MLGPTHWRAPNQSLFRKKYFIISLYFDLQISLGHTVYTIYIQLEPLDSLEINLWFPLFCKFESQIQFIRKYLEWLVCMWTKRTSILFSSELSRKRVVACLIEKGWEVMEKRVVGSNTRWRVCLRISKNIKSSLYHLMLYLYRF